MRRRFIRRMAAFHPALDAIRVPDTRQLAGRIEQNNHYRFFSDTSLHNQAFSCFVNIACLRQTDIPGRTLDERIGIVKRKLASTDFNCRARRSRDRNAGAGRA